MLVTSRFVLNLESGACIEKRSYPYEGPVDLCGGGKSAARNNTTQQMQNMAGLSTQDQAASQQAFNLAQQDLSPVTNFAQSLMSTTPGSLSPYASAQYGSSMDQITNDLNQQRAMDIAASGQSGFGSSPGANASMMNTLTQQGLQANTQAFQQALQNTLSEGETGAGMLQGASGEEAGIGSTLGSQGLQASNASTQDAMARIQEGSTLGDVMSGIGSLASTAANIGGMAGLGSVARGALGSSGSSLGSTPGFGVNGTAQSYIPGGLLNSSGGYSGNKGFGGVSRFASTGVGNF